MSKKNRQTLSLPREQNSAAPTENTMSTSQETNSQAETPATEQALPEPTAKALAQAEEENAARLVRQAKSDEARIAAEAIEPIPLVSIAAQGHNILHDHIRAQRERPKPEYVPPPRTERQMSQLQEELEAGRRTQQRAEEQQASRPVEKVDGNKEGFTTPAYRPNDMVPDPMTGRMGVMRPTE